MRYSEELGVKILTHYEHFESVRKIIFLDKYPIPKPDLLGKRGHDTYLIEVKSFNPKRRALQKIRQHPKNLDFLLIIDLVNSKYLFLRPYHFWNGQSYTIHPKRIKGWKSFCQSVLETDNLF